MRRLSRAVLLSLLALAASCKTVSSNQDQDTTLSSEDTSGLVEWVDGQTVTVDLGNKGAFEQKLRVIDAAQRSIRIAYFIFGFDDTSSVLAKKLLAKAAQGVEVKILVDGMTALKWREWWQMLVAESQKSASEGQGKAIEVVYFRPVEEAVWQDFTSWGFTDRALLESAAAGLDITKIESLIKSNTLISNSPGMKLLISTLLPTKESKSSMVSVLRDAAMHGKYPNDPAFDAFLDSLFQSAGGSGLTFRTRAWINLIKRLHHKLLIVDDKLVMGGGRNIADHYHVDVDYGPKEESDDLLSFMDADFLVESSQVAASAAKTFDDYWKCTDQLSACKAKIPMVRERAHSGDYAALRQKLDAQASRYENEMRTYQPDAARIIQNGRLTATNVRVGYLENRMGPVRRGTERLAFGEEPSQYNTVWENLIGNAKAGEDVVIHSAYVLLPPGMQLAIIKALKSGAKVRILTNSDASSNHAETNVAANAQYAALLVIGDKIRQELAAEVNPVRVYLYQSRETLHSKIGLAGDYMIVGSTNADPRSKILDTQNGLVIGPGPNGNAAAAEYRQWLSTLLQKQRAGKQIVKELTLEAARETFPAFDKVRAAPDDYRSDQQFDAFTSRLFEIAMDPATDRPTQILVGGLLNTLFLNL